MLIGLNQKKSQRMNVQATFVGHLALFTSLLLTSRLLQCFFSCDPRFAVTWLICAQLLPVQTKSRINENAHLELVLSKIPASFIPTTSLQVGTYHQQHWPNDISHNLFQLVQYEKSKILPGLYKESTVDDILFKFANKRRSVKRTSLCAETDNFWNEINNLYDEV